MEHPARYLAQRLRAEHSLSPVATTAELLEVCRQRGVFVVRSRTLEKSGVYLPDDALIILRWDAPAWVLAHELYHYLTHDNAEHEVIYTYPDFLDDGEEFAAELFAWLLCGEGA